MGFLRKIDWTSALLVFGMHVLGAAGIYYLLAIHFAWQTILLTGCWYLMRMWSISGGYHRYYTHKSFECSLKLQLFFIIFGPAAWQRSAIQWVSDHERHHHYTDTDKDPYNAQRGFWWAHIGWLIFRDTTRDVSNVPDLLANPLTRFEDRFYFLIAIGSGLMLPSLIALIWGDPLGGLLVAGFTGLMFVHHVTYTVNSVSHYFGNQPYTLSSARQGWIMALPTFGEGGDHNFHHAFSWDYRAGGHEWYRIDPSKWILCVLSYFGVVWNRRHASPERILCAKEEVLAQREAIELLTAK